MPADIFNQRKLLNVTFVASCDRVFKYTFHKIMFAFLTVVRYPKWALWAGFLSMAFFRLPLFFNKKISFYKLMGCGKNGTFDKVPDLQQWAILVVTNKKSKHNSFSSFNYESWYGSLLTKWWSLFGCTKWTIVLEPIEGHGKWDGKEIFGSLPKTSDFDGKIAVLTRATIRVQRLKHFWNNVDKAARAMSSSPGFITSLGIGEIPWIKQATFSVWENKDSLKMFAYKNVDHAEVIRKTRQEKWYSEDMFVRFKILYSIGTINGANPLQRNL